MIVSFFVPGLPVAQPRQRHRKIPGQSFVHNYTPTKHPVSAFKATIKLAASAKWNAAPPMVGPVRLSLVFYFPRPISQTRKRGNSASWKTTKPDWDNLGKAVSDALNGVLWVDDAQLCDTRVSKWICGDGEAPGVHVEVTSLA
jgi:Holliday junction resolvase RusA-like endonuclease